MKKKLLGDNYKYYESKFMMSPNENTNINSYTLHQRRKEKVVYGTEIYEEQKLYKSNKAKRHKKKGYRAKSKKIIKTKMMPINGEEDNNYVIYNKYYASNYCDGREGEEEGEVEGEEEEYEEYEENHNYGQRQFYYQ